MGYGTDAARAEAPEHAAMIDTFKEALLLILIKRAGGRVKISADEIDSAGELVLLMNLEPEKRTFNFEVRKKH